LFVVGEEPATRNQELEYTMQPIIQLKNLEKCVKTKAGPLYLLRQINLEVEDGEFMTIMGPSGAGKSTLLHILGMYDSAWEGEYHLEDLRWRAERDQSA
jgi:ABC-type lipoprotein export system ATPase subunit